MKNEMTVKTGFGSWYRKDQNFARLFIILIALIVVFTLVNPAGFMSIDNFQSMLYQFPEFGLMAFGIMLTMIIGGIDLSVVGMANLTSIITASMMLAIVPKEASSTQTFFLIVVCAAIGIAVGASAGYLNGNLVSRLRIPPILATLGTQQLFTGIGLIVTKGSSVSRLPMMYAEMGTYRIGGVVPVVLFVFIGVVVVLSILLGKTKFGRQLYLMGSNPVAAKFSGINNTSITNRAHMYSGILSAIAGLIMLANYNSAKPDYGSAYTLQCILIVVLGGVNPNGGFGKVGGVTMAILILQILSSGLNLFPNVSNFYRPLIWGAVLLAVLTINYVTEVGAAKKIARASSVKKQTN